jgi:hypothetical protein
MQYTVDRPCMALVFRVLEAPGLAPLFLSSHSSHPPHLAGITAHTKAPAVAGWREWLGWDLERAKKPTASGIKFLKVSAYITALVFAVCDFNETVNQTEAGWREDSSDDHVPSSEDVSSSQPSIVQAARSGARARVMLHEPGFLSVLARLCDASGARQGWTQGSIECLTDDAVQAAHLRRY